MNSISLPAITKGVNTTEEKELLKPDECSDVQGFRMFKGVWRKDFSLERKDITLAHVKEQVVDGIVGCKVEPPIVIIDPTHPDPPDPLKGTIIVSDNSLLEVDDTITLTVDTLYVWVFAV